MEFTEEVSQKLTEYLKQDDIRNICIKLGIFLESNTLEEMLENTKTYITEIMRGKFIKDSATDKFLNVIKYYLTNKDFERFIGDEYIPNGFINSNIVLPVVGERKDGFRASEDILGFDGKKYIVKNAEGLKSGAAGRKNARDARYNPTVAYAFFKLIGMPCARSLPACEKIPYYYIISENFLNENQKAYGLDSEKFMDTEFIIDGNNNSITHKQIMDGIQETINKKDLPLDKKILLIKKLKLQYAVQETLKSLICSFDQNLGNTSLIVTEAENGEIEDINVAPAYDLDLSFNLGEEMLRGVPENEVLYRTTQDGKIDLLSIVNEFKGVDGYKEAVGEIKNKLSDNYINQIFDIAYEESKVEIFKNKELKDKFANFIMRRVATFKEACKELVEREDKSKSE
jgi:hypothetical protein